MKEFFGRTHQKDQVKGQQLLQIKNYEQHNMSNLNQSLTMIKRKCQQN